ncbi:NADH dehydrogenase [ubiquinone] 1 alpha subcomplex subunit 2 [Diabrotica undecimpunctata]|uniref:NADH dehydrogenase [ubiquinone] 1 alpha subcomplex subunit 2 n=1 Tax=Diabrotica undecimpunctata TaxID=50387 RepID=UPI003B6368AC
MAVRFGSALKELRIHLCQTGAASKGVRDFIEKHYVQLKSSNPKFPILVRECSGVEPRLWARYDLGKEKCVSLKDLSPEDVLNRIQAVAKGL